MLQFSFLHTAVDLKTPPGRLYRGEPQGVKAGCTMTIDDDNFVALANGDLNPQQVIRSRGLCYCRSIFRLSFKGRSRLLVMLC